MRHVMEHKGYKAKVMEAEKLTGDRIHGLPPGTPLNIYHSDEFVEWPENWMKGPGIFLIPVRPNKGIWFDWRENSPVNTAVVPTIKGSNPYTGLQTSGFFLEKYEEKCPKHNKLFIGDRFCEECGYKWAPQNYLSPSNILWLDGWLNPKDGTVRQFFFSEDELRDIATHLIGKENTVPAFGFAFFSPKERRAEMTVSSRVFTSSFVYGSSTNYPLETIKGCNLSGNGTNNSMLGLTLGANALNMSDGESHVYCCDTASATSGPVCPPACIDNISDDLERLTKASLRSKKLSSSGSVGVRGVELKSVQKKAVKEVSIGAGAKINQCLNHDTYPLDSWKEAPDSVMTIYFIFQEKFEELKAGGMRNLEGSPEGILAGLPVG